MFTEVMLEPAEYDRIMALVPTLREPEEDDYVDDEDDWDDWDEEDEVTDN